MKAKPWSSPSTTKRALALLEDLDWSRVKVADVGAGRGWFSKVVADRLRSRHLDPREHVFPCDAVPSSFEAEGLECRALLPDGRLPYPDRTFDAAVSIEVVEHVEDQFAFLRELARIVKSDGWVVVTTPNVLSLASRVRMLLWGFPQLFDPLPLEGGDRRVCSGHIHPISAYFLAHAALRAGLSEISLHSDRTKRSSAFLALLLGALLFPCGWFHRVRLARKHPAVYASNRKLIDDQLAWGMLTSRTVVMRARKRGS